ncbi:hypothetical protein LPH45_04630 [Xylella taiwanensis]|uniref:hypothetical protein n=1 Tax=Xylella taiwanensis TaxID=1444770 RepID=UPI00136363DF|nr:hypothetical protein [Xylella taiwanensis]UFN09911.1 hypothetical protein LPH45_04630 [Xylella taiwanensis]UFN14494.1 hypothetical protein LPH61_04605 [Xylella taiwanensis]UFN19048.1 hypothetical protein LPH64_04750 [Xylella taiwanensis]UFN31846.1 hypothetical protein LPH63_00935 [Xylella taiwanensis]
MLTSTGDSLLAVSSRGVMFARQYRRRCCNVPVIALPIGEHRAAASHGFEIGCTADQQRAGVGEILPQRAQIGGR